MSREDNLPASERSEASSARAAEDLTPSERAPSRRIEDYGLIGDCETAALVANDGSIEWMCLPRFDSPASFAAMLGNDENGVFRIAPKGGVRRTRRRYVGDTLVLETEFETETGTVALVDFMPPREGGSDLVRIVYGRRGRVVMRAEVRPRFDYGELVPWFRRLDGAVLAYAGPDALRVRATCPLDVSEDAVCAEFAVEAGQSVAWDLTHFPSHEEPPAPIDPEAALARTTEFWNQWVARCTYGGRYRDAVVRSLITLKALTYAPTGAIVAAPTTSLPEHFGSVRNWDYRYCWLRDAAFTLLALMNGGYTAEAQAFREWFLRATAGRASQVHIMYGIAGERRLVETELDHLSGFADSRPVRIGNGAFSQFQLDVYGEVVDAMHQAWVTGLDPKLTGWELERAMVEFVETAWQRPDEGIWEVRGPRRHFTHSKVMAWVALDRAVRAGEKLGLGLDALDRWRALARTIHDEVCTKAYDQKVGSFVQAYGTEALDASVLVMPLVGFLPIDDPRIQSTIAAIERGLTNGVFVSRYQADGEVDGLPAGEGAFLLCSYWLADCLAMSGRIEDGTRIFEGLLEVRNDLGLLSESYDVGGKRLAGNFPQAFSHIGLVNTACALTRHGRGPRFRT
jgi:GH15 family glucan-1,4-alpha-glucosidase